MQQKQRLSLYYILLVVLQNTNWLIFYVSINPQINCLISVTLEEEHHINISKNVKLNAFFK